MDSGHSSDSVGHDPFLLTTRFEILHILRKIQELGLLIRLRVPYEGTSVVTTILELDPDDNLLLVDAAKHAYINEAINQADAVQFETSLDGVRIEFNADFPELIELDQRPAFALTIPEGIRRLQRREFFRVAIPVSDPACCTLTLQGESRTLALYDISPNGMALIDTELDPRLQAGQRFENCMLDLKETGLLTVSFEIMRVKQVLMPSGKAIHHLGVQFTDISNSAQNLIQSYATNLERLHIARQRGMST